MTSLLDASVLRQVLREYLTSNPPKNAKDVNSQAELKAVSHWRWLKDSENAESVPGPHDDPRLKEAAKFALETWKDKLLKHEEVKQQPPCKREKMENGDRLSSDDIISGIAQENTILHLFATAKPSRKAFGNCTYMYPALLAVYQGQER